MIPDITGTEEKKVLKFRRSKLKTVTKVVVNLIFAKTPIKKSVDKSQGFSKIIMLTQLICEIHQVKER